LRKVKIFLRNVTKELHSTSEEIETKERYSLASSVSQTFACSHAMRNEL
jgi:hypothetical protein